MGSSSAEAVAGVTVTAGISAGFGGGSAGRAGEHAAIAQALANAASGNGRRSFTPQRIVVFRVAMADA
jgi:hypothetical protein